jgi:glycosyltransferase involved in cell wall biosynthesis
MKLNCYKNNDRINNSRVLMYSTYFPPQYSGAAMQSISLALHLKKLGYRVEFVTIKDIGSPEFDVVQGFPVYRIEAAGRRNKEYPFWLNLLRFSWRNRHRFDICHSHGAYYMNSVIGPIAKICKWKSVAKASLTHSDFSGLKKSPVGHLHFSFLKMIDAYVAISQGLQEEIRKTGLPEKKLHYIPNGVDTNRFHPPLISEKRELRKTLDLPRNKIIALTVGVFDMRKNLGWLIEQWTKNPSFFQEFFLLAVGPQSREDKGGAFLRTLHQTAEENKTNVRILGYTPDIERLYKAADLFILPSQNEGLPNALLEAMASGLPCLASRVSGSTDLIEEGANGFTFAHGNFQEFHTKLFKILNDNNHHMGKMSRLKIVKDFALTTIARKYHQLYQSL